jgi:catechol 2,3-dioxygenase-like lactoylglutathione lyase family enzyme
MSPARYFAHANINTPDFDRACDFYTQVLGLTSLGLAEPTFDQDGGPFGLGGQAVRFRGALLADGRHLRGPIVDLLEWTQPVTAVDTVAPGDAPGFTALGFAVPSLTDVVAQLEQHGLPVRHATLVLDGHRSDVLLTTDVDGQRIELVAGPDTTRYESIRVVCRDLSASLPFYQDALHLDTDEPADYSIEHDGDIIESGRVVRAYLPGQREKFWLNLVEPSDAARLVAPTRRGNTQGIYRVALRVDDIEEAYADLRTHLPGTREPDQIPVSPDYPPVPALFFVDPDGTVFEYLVGIYT